jgi:xanthine dehydrogenase accessory factor
VLRAPGDGILVGLKRIGEHCEAGEVIASLVLDRQPRATEPIYSPFRGVLRGLIQDGIRVMEGMKIGDVDARDDPAACFLVSDKSLAIGGAVLEAVLAKKEIRALVY